MEKRLVSVGVLRQVLAGEGEKPLSAMAISYFVKDGMPKVSRGVYDLHACVDWWACRLAVATLTKSKLIRRSADAREIVDAAMAAVLADRVRTGDMKER